MLAQELVYPLAYILYFIIISFYCQSPPSTIQIYSTSDLYSKHTVNYLLNEYMHMRRWKAPSLHSKPEAKCMHIFDSYFLLSLKVNPLPVHTNSIS